MPSPYDLHDMVEGVDLFEKTVNDNKKIKCVCDSDCDGVNTYKLFYDFFTIFPYTNLELVITDRKKGYGFQPYHVDEDTSLYITSDNGITSVEATKAANSKGAKVIICDHHQPDLDKLGLPQAAAIIDPYHPDCTFEPKEISGTFVLYFFIEALIGRFDIGVDAFDMFLDSIAITTVSDVMPLSVPLNRFVVKTFVDKFCQEEKSKQPYLNAFRSEVNDSPTAESFAFGLIPVINATQRIKTADLAALFLISTEEDSVPWFNYIKSLNDERKERQQTLLTHIEKYYKEYISKPFIIIPGKFHSEFKGVLGIIAGRLAEMHNKPCIVMNYNPDKKEYSGSGRSIGELNILGVLRNNSNIANVGGHKQALGITVKEDVFEAFYNQVQEEIVKVPSNILHPPKKPFGFIPINKLSKEFYDALFNLEPFGHKFKKPVFATTGVLKTARLVGKQKNHLTVTITDKKGLVKYKGIQFFTTETPETGKEYIFHFKFDLDNFGKSDNIQLMIDKIEPIV